MVYPDTGLPLVVEIAPGANSAGDPGEWPWTDVTYAASLADGDNITIGEGRTDWGAKVDAGSIALTFKNQSGDFSEWNPLGKWYGSLGRDTPLRVRLKRVEDAFGRTVSNGWGTADSGQSWTVASGPTAAWSVGSGAGQVSISAVNAYRRILLPTTLLDVEQRWDITPSVALTGASLVWQARVRYQDANNSYGLSVELDRNTGFGLTVTCKIRKMVGGVITDIATASPVSGAIYTAGQPVHVRAAVYGTHLGVKAWTGSTEPVGWSCEVDDSTFTVPGQIGHDVYLVSGNTNTLPYTLTITGYQALVDLAGGFVPAWVPRWDRSGKIRTVPVSAKGVLYRTQPATGKPPARSPMWRTLAATSPVAWWPLEDGQVAGQAASAIPGHPAATVSSAITFNPISEYYISNPNAEGRFGVTGLAELTQGGRIDATVPPSVTEATRTRWAIYAVTLVDTASISGDITLLEWTTPGGTYVRWQLVMTTANHTKVFAYDSSGTQFIMLDDGSASTGYARQMVLTRQAGANIVVELWRNGGFGGAPNATITTPATLSGVTSVASNASGTTSTVQTGIGQITLWAASTPPIDGDGSTIDSYGAVVGLAAASYVWETAVDRIQRLAAEDGTALSVLDPPSAAGVVRMGPQPPGISPDLYQEPVVADMGYLAERPFRLEYRPRESLYNQAPALSMTASQLGESPEPDPLDQAYRNRITVTRTLAGPALAGDAEGSSAVSEAPEVADGAIVYDDQAKVALGFDSDLQPQADWRLHLASTRGLRWPKLTINLAAEPGLIDAWLNCRPGSRIRVTQPPEDVAGQDIDVILEGHTTTLGYKDWDVSANFSPAGLWDVAEADGDQRVAADGSTVGSTLALGATSMSLASTAAGGPWTTDTADFPLDVSVGGERITLSGITGSTSPQTAAISARGVNGVTRAHAAGTPVDVWAPAIMSL